MDTMLDSKLNSFDPQVRKAALMANLPASTSFNMHCHSFFSYNGYGYSPSYLVALAKKLNWRAVGLVDFDVLDGVDEFMAALSLYGVRGCAGMETRVFIPELADVEINSPGEPGVAYHLGCGFKSSQVPAEAAAFAKELREKANGRTRQVVELVNTSLTEIALNFDAVAKEFTPAGNVTERHVCQAYRVAAQNKFKGEDLAQYWTSKLGSFEADPVKLEALIRSKLMKKGGVGYIQPKPESFPTLEEMNKFIISCGAVPTLAWLNGTSAGEADPAKLIDLHIAAGGKAATIIPDRNWNYSDPEKRAKFAALMDDFIAACNERNIPILAGTEMNAPGQKLADDFMVPELAKHLDTFISGVDAFVL